MSRFLNEKYAQLVPYTPGEQPRGIQNLIKLNTNESPFAPSPLVLEALSREEAMRLRLYPDPTCADFLAVLGSYWGLAPTRVFAGNGSDEVLAFAFQGLCQRGAAFADITYGFYPVFAQLYGVQTHVVPLREDFTLAVEDYADEQGTVFLANPNAPTGLALPPEKIETLLQQNPNRLVVVDEAYVDFGGETARPLLEQYDNLLIVGTFSKSRSLAGARLGYALGSEALIADLNTIKFSFNPYNINRLTLLAGTAAVRDGHYFSACRESIIATRQRVRQALCDMGFAVTESKANFLFAAPPAPLTGDSYFTALRRHSILVRHFDAPRIADYVRITIGTDAQMDTFLAVTQQLVKESAT